MAILIDLRARQQALPLEFLGHPANIAGGVGLMAWLAGAVVLPCSVVRVGWARHEAKLLDQIVVDREADKGAEIERITRRALSVLGAEVMKSPEQYFWYNKRWVLQPLAADADADSREGLSTDPMVPKDGTGRS
jgi:lauroyl/myristoyl acyltransferase